jgi:polyphosphate glucokinase
MKILMIDVGGTNVKFMCERGGEMRKIKSHRAMSAAEMAEGVIAAAADWTYDAVSIGYPGLLQKGRPVRDPLNLGVGWLNFDYEKAFQKPVRMINDAAMQALGNYVHGRLLFLGFGTSIGTCVIADDTVLPIETGLIKLSKNARLIDKISKQALKEDGIKTWLEAVQETIDLLRDVFRPDEIVLGGGNAELIDPLPADCRPVDNASAYAGAERLWEEADLYASARESTWQIVRRENRAS